MPENKYKYIDGTLSIGDSLGYCTIPVQLVMVSYYSSSSVWGWEQNKIRFV